MREFGVGGVGGVILIVQPTTSICLSPEPPGEAGQGWMRPTASPGQDLQWSSGAAESILETPKV